MKQSGPPQSELDPYQTDQGSVSRTRRVNHSCRVTLQYLKHFASEDILQVIVKLKVEVTP